tara:strand:+ start:1694 stop:1984 length:291 start_codon:yes stop_codon:yes gene_type:complete
MINGPKGAVPTNRGWVSPKGELLKAQKLTNEQISEWEGTFLTEVPMQHPSDPLEHTHDNGVTHSHDGGDKPHEHEEVQENLFEDKPKKKKSKWSNL